MMQNSGPTGSAFYKGAIGADGRRVVTTHGANASLWDPATRRRIAVLRAHKNNITDIAISAGSRAIATGTGAGVVVWDGATGARRGRIARANGLSASFTAFSADGRTVVVGDQSGDVVLHDAHNLRRLAAITYPADRLGGAFGHFALTPDAKRVIATDDDLWVYALASARPLHHARLPVDQGQDFVLSPDGRLIVTYGATSQTWVYDARSARPITRLDITDATRVVFSRDSQRVIAVGDDDVARVFGVRDHAALTVLRAGSESVTDAAFSADGRLAVTAAGDSAARVFATRSGRLVDVIYADFSPVLTAAFHGDEDAVVLAGPFGRPSIRRCYLCGSLASARALATRRVTRGLTTTERARYLHESAATNATRRPASPSGLTRQATHRRTGPERPPSSRRTELGRGRRR